MSLKLKEHLKLMQKNHILMEEMAFNPPKTEESKSEQTLPTVKRIFNPMIKENIRENHLF